MSSHPVDASGMCLVSAQWPHLLSGLPVEEKCFTVSTSSAEQLTVW